ncbi:hypothetical protein XOC_0403 [Xanthomonas oryzae pv. oryzicola BLS256]|uniref:Uncharacterized protein n=1 Tax=Xanthomonas oryzae pv. oryzicola (strain BLS256) TaxID=383407 RepID=G7TLL3_XANOB|nr:hypothetical protein XOC_0403 [Xanthomonas oryzae pv. oryzicola BLS256]
MLATRTRSAAPSDLPAAASPRRLSGWRPCPARRQFPGNPADAARRRRPVPTGSGIRAAFLRLEREAAIGATRTLDERVIVAEEPDWDTALALERCGRSRDLRVAGKLGRLAAWPPGRSGEIAGPDDVKRRREEICAYHAWHAPSTPVPMLLRRAQRLVGADFLVLMKRLAPAGIDALQRVTGPPEES